MPPNSSLRDLLLITWHGREAAIDWLLIDSAGRIGGSRHDAGPPAAVVERAREIVVLWPGERGTLISAALPARHAEQALKAAPFAIEEQLATAVDNLHFAVTANGPGRWWIAAVEPGPLRECLADLKARGIEPSRLLPDVLALPATNTGAHLLRDGERVLLRIGTERALVADQELLDMLLESAGIRHDQVKELNGSGSQSTLELLAGHLSRAESLNLLRGDFSVRRHSGDALAPWRRLGWLALAVLVLGFAYVRLDQWRLERRLTALQSEMLRVYREQFPGAQQIPNPVAQMRSALAAAGGRSDAGGGLGLLARAAPVLVGQNRASLRSAELRNGILLLAVAAPDIETLDALRESIGVAVGSKAVLESVESGDGGIDGRIRLEAGK